MSYDKTEMNAFAQHLYDQKMQEGKHGHYETMFHVVHKAIERAALQSAQPVEASQPKFFVGTDMQDGVLTVSVLQREPDGVAVLVHHEEITVSAQPVALPLTEAQKLDIVTQWFTAENDITRAMQVLTDFEQTTPAVAIGEKL